MNITLFTHAQRFVGIREIAGQKDHPLVAWWHSLCGLKETPDEVAWCSSFLNGMAWELRLPRSKSAAARSWLEVGEPVPLNEAKVGYDVVILKRGPDPQPGPEVTSQAPGHVGLFAGWGAVAGTPIEFGAQTPQTVLLLAGNQGNAVSIAPFPLKQILGIRRLFTEP